MHRTIPPKSWASTMKWTTLTAALMSTSLMASSAFAGGFEKSLMFSGRYSGIAGAAASSVEGSESLYWNPAGLTRNQDDRRHHFSVNVSPTFSSFSGPLSADNQSIDSRASSTLPLGVFYSYHRDKYSLGVGYYAAGGTNVEFNNHPVGATTANFASKIRVPELSLGGSYAITDKLRLGLAYRLGMAQADYAVGAVNPQNPGVIGVYNYEDFSDEAHGFRLGLQYEEDDWGIGFSYRSRMNYRFSGRGTVDARVLANGATVASGAGSVLVSTEFPQVVQLGGHYNFSEKWRGFAEVWWTEYSQIERLNFESAAIPDGAPLDFETRWKDQWNFRFAGEYGDIKEWPIRFGYILTTAVTPTDRARATFSTAGLGHTFTTGTGYEFAEGFRLDAAYEYSFASASIDANPANSVFAGRYRSQAHVVHVGLNVEF